MAEVSFPSPWRIWTQAQREAMLRDYVRETCKGRGYSEKEKWHAEVTGREPASLASHVNSFMMKNRSRMDTYDHTKGLAKIAAHHICPEDSGMSPSGGVSPQGAGMFRSALDIVASLVFPWTGYPQLVVPTAEPMEGLTFGGVLSVDETPSPVVAEISEPVYPEGWWPGLFGVSPFDAQGMSVFAGQAFPQCPAVP